MDCSDSNETAIISFVVATAWTMFTATTLASKRLSSGIPKECSDFSRSSNKLNH
jgi:hypothetical protein